MEKTRLDELFIYVDKNFLLKEIFWKYIRKSEKKC